MKFTIDTDVVKKLDIPKEVFFHALALYFCKRLPQDLPEKANKLGYNIKDLGCYFRNHEVVELVEDVITRSSMDKASQGKDYRSLARRLINLYPRGLKEGTNRTWRCSEEEVIQKLRFLEYATKKEILPEQAIKATENYLGSFYDLRFMKSLSKFLCTTKNVEDDGLAWTSDFLSFMENLDE